jgi:hypothetical protein
VATQFLASVTLASTRARLTVPRRRLRHAASAERAWSRVQTVVACVTVTTSPG